MNLRRPIHRPVWLHALPRVIARFIASLVPFVVAVAPFSALAAGLPTMEDPSRGAGSGILQTLQNYGYDIVMLVALLVIASMFIGICYQRLWALLRNP
jgi:integrating conjugative element membrane protein (TIGR03745 family)